MGQIGVAYGTGTALGINLSTGMIEGSARESDLINNNSTQAIDIHVQVKMDLISGTPGSERAIYIYAYGNAATSELASPATGADATITLTGTHQFAEIGRIVTHISTATSTAASVHTSRVFSVASAFGVLPKRTGIVIHNKSNITATTSTSLNTATYYTVSLATL